MAFTESVKRSVTKSITFRILVMIADGFIIYALTGKVTLALSVIIFSNVSSTVIYYFHERAWSDVHWGKQKKSKKKGIT